MSGSERFMVSPCELYSLDSFSRISQGADILNICMAGGRSSGASTRLSEVGVQSYYLSCGLLGLYDLDQKYLELVISRIKSFSNIFVFAYVLEVDQHQKMLNQICPSGVFRDEVEFIREVKNGKVQFHHK